MAIQPETQDTASHSETDPLIAYGWDGFFADSLEALAASSPEGSPMEPARVLELRRGSFLVVARDGGGSTIEREAKPSGKLSSRCATKAAWPATGDWVVLRGPAHTGYPDGVRAGTCIVEAVLPRRSAFSRKAAGDSLHDKVAEQVLAANIDTAFIVTAAGTDFSVRRIERYAALALDAGIAPVVIVTKADLAGDSIADLVAAAGEACPFVPAFAVCAPECRGLDAMLKYLKPHSTSILIGSSGSGKSTLLNALAGEQLNDTGAVKDFDQRGRHTTTARTLFTLANGAMVIDTPGLREVQLWLGEDSVDGVFTEIDEAAASCRFSDCSHVSEPGCAVLEALANGSISTERYESWLRLGREARFLETKTSVTARLEQKARRKMHGRLVKRFIKNAGI